MLTKQNRWAAVLAAGLVLAVTVAMSPAQDAAPAPAPAPAAPAAPADPAAPAPADPAAPAAPAASLQTQWEDFLHYVKISNAKAAESFAKAILESGAEPMEVYSLSERYPDSLAVIARGSRLEGMKPLTDRLRKVIEKGYLQMRSNPAEIARSIAMLGGTIRQFRLGEERLKMSGEFALPQLIQKLAAQDTPSTLRSRIVVALPRLGTQIARGLSVVLTADDPRLVEVVANTLGKLESPVATPRLKELTERKGLLARVRDTAGVALKACGGTEQDKGLAQLFYDQAVKYYYRAESLKPDPRDENANVWYWTGGLLVPKSVPREIFCDVMAMRMARLALQYDENMQEAVSLWLSANIRKELDLPSGATDPVRGADQPAARYYALASPASYLQAVLARALKDDHPGIAVAAIKALGDTQGAPNLVLDTPLVKAMNYQDRRVRFLAAETLANAHPVKPFPGSEIVLWVLGEAIRQGNKTRALLMVAQTDTRNSLKSALRAAGCEVIDEPDVDKGLHAARAAGGVDVVVLATQPEPVDVLAKLRGDPLFFGTGVILAAKGSAFRNLAEDDKKAVTADPGADATAIKAALAQAAMLGGKPLTTDEATQWAVRACKAVRGLGLTKNAVLDVNRAQSSLLAATGDPRAAVQTAAANALAILPAAQAQRGIVDLAMNASDEAVRIAAFNAGSESVRRWGRQTTDEQADAVLAVVEGKGSPELKNAAAQLLGAMDLPSRKVKSLIGNTAGMD